MMLHSCRLGQPHLTVPSLLCRATSALLISKRWHRVFMSEPALWRQFGGVCRTAASELALLRRVGGLANELCLGTFRDGSDEQAEALSLVQPSLLQELQAWSSAPRVLAALPRFSRLTRLDFGAYDYDTPPGLAGALLQLPRLQRLSVNGQTLSEQHVAAIAATTQLMELSIEVACFEEPQSLLQLTRLRQLSALQLVAQRTGECYDAPAPALLPALKWYAFSTSEEEFDEHTVVRVGSVQPPCATTMSLLAPLSRSPSTVAYLTAPAGPSATGVRLPDAVLQLCGEAGWRLPWLHG